MRAGRKPPSLEREIVYDHQQERVLCNSPLKQGWAGEEKIGYFELTGESMESWNLENPREITLTLYKNNHSGKVSTEEWQQVLWSSGYRGEHPITFESLK